MSDKQTALHARRARIRAIRAKALKRLEQALAMERIRYEFALAERQRERQRAQAHQFVSVPPAKWPGAWF